MAKHGKKYLAAAEKIDRETAITNQKKRSLSSRIHPPRNLTPQSNLHLRLGVDPRHADQQSSRCCGPAAWVLENQCGW